MRKILLVIGILINACQAAVASPCTIPTIYATTGQVTAINLNGNFAACQGVVNGLLDNMNANTAGGYEFLQVVSSLPSAGNQGRAYIQTSDNSLNIDTGSAFIKTIGPSGSPSQGNVLIYGASGITYATTGSSGQPFISQGAGANAEFGNISLAGSVSGAALTSLPSTPVGAGLFPAANIGGIVGAQTSKSWGTIYQAATDGMVEAYETNSSGPVSLSGLTDSNSTPITVVQKGYQSTASNYSNESFLVKKNNYYECVDVGATATTQSMSFTPIGS